MSVSVTFGSLSDGAGMARITLSGPRSNALTPELLDALSDALDRTEAAGASAILISGGRNFSTGGDVRAFREAVLRGQGRAYAARLVPALQAVVLRLLSLPCLVAVAARGAVTGGSAGVLFAADMAAVSPGCFVQPYYAGVGFAPDGGWTAVLPERIDAGAASRWLMRDRRVAGEELVRIGLADACDAEPEAVALRLLDRGRTGPRLDTKALIWDPGRRAEVRARLDRETEAFLDRIERVETLAGMENFLAGMKEEHAHV